MTIELVSFADLKTILSLEKSAIGDYPDLMLLRDSVTYAIESYLSRSLESNTYTETLYQDRAAHMISLKAIPLSSVTSVTVTQAGVDTVLDSDSYEITDYGILIDAETDTERCKIVTVYAGGYLAANVSPIIKRAALLQTAFEYQSKDNIGAEFVSNSGGSTQKPELGLLAEVQRLLSPFKHPLSWV